MFQRASHEHFQVLGVNSATGQRLVLYDKHLRGLAYLFPIPEALMETL